ncbi:metalloregulator ArsR/SmtB family transcription factor [Paractinoplanes brasiliensis]|uniref:DNA-binding transcriptional ArsR family regulator n=1 Tax=Paractinoplanes brasiliensis TaxID=52695 RepID=A0A4R6JBM0_9ACTN|nr:metalloregulator ArsR/SmtB family transcription factor [Actinoplanes brasiliensis]TDO31915.1 DNA-binding transcriptional ArsR family regulator [Actinoplanes brasiliensis]GID27957.1 hypothetical protein Abr02nite_29400 [Actinoplanes brasiliensis]
MDRTAAAIADPVRRHILAMLRDGELPARRIAERFPISRPAVSRHLRVLRESGLVHDTLVGRERMYRLDTGPLTEVAEWIAGFGAPVAGLWSQRLDALETEVHRTRRDRRDAKNAARGAGETATNTRAGSGDPATNTAQDAGIPAQDAGMKTRTARQEDIA